MDAQSLHSTLPVFPLAIFGPLDWGIVGLYFAAMIYIGVIAARKDQNAREYFLAHRSMPTWAVAISIVATSLSAATFVGVPDAAYKGNLSYLIVTVGSLLAVFIVAIVFIPRLYRAGTVTIYGYLNQRYGEGAMIAVSVMFLFGRMLASGARLFIAAIPLGLLMFAGVNGTASSVTHGQRVLAIALIGGVGTFYTAFGGIRTVIWIDVIQFFIVIGAALLSIFLLFKAIPYSSAHPYLDVFKNLASTPAGPGGHSKLFVADTHFDLTSPFTLWGAIFGWTFLSVAAFGVDQDLAQRFLVAKSAARGAMSLIWSQLISIVVIAGFLLIGLLLYVFYQNGHTRPLDGEATYPWFLLNEMPTICSGIAIVGFFAIAQGSMDSAINALASSAVADIYYPLRRKMGLAVDPGRDTATPKLMVALMGACMSLFGIVCVFVYDPHDQTLLDFALGIMTFAFTGMLGVFLTALLTRRGNTASVIIALVAGVVTVVLLQPKLLQWWTGLLFPYLMRLGGARWMPASVAGWFARLFSAPAKLASPWWMPIGTLVSFVICVSGKSRRVAPPVDSGAAIPVVASTT